MNDDSMQIGSISIEHIIKKYQLFDRPVDRLKEAFSPTHRKYSKDYYALRDISLQINKGESIGLVGTNGSGKSTLLKLITGVVTPTEGRIRSNGKIAALLELGAGFNMEYTGLENIYLNGTMMGYSEKEMKQRVQSIIDFADIGDFINQPVKTYSSGMFARLAFSVSIHVEPDILIVDEALSVGDTRFQVKCIDKMRSLQEEGTTILFVTHATEQIKRFCTRAIWIKDGQIRADGEAAQIVDEFSNYMKYGEREAGTVFDCQEFRMPKDSSVLAAIQNVELNKEHFQSFEPLEVRIVYDVFDEHMEDLQVGVAMYSQDRGIYVFGPNTNLDKVQVPQEVGRHEILYRVPSMTLLSGGYVIDVGIFNSNGIVNLDYKESCRSFSVTNEYFSEGMLYLEHEWIPEGKQED